jgi:sirohydrochlorin ferrochelatase
MSGPNSRTAIVLFAHGSSVQSANEGVHRLTQLVEQEGSYPYVRAAFLEPFEPSLAQATRQAVDAGFMRILVIPYFLTLGLHLQRDLPRLLAAERARYPEVEIWAGESLEGHPSMSAVLLARIHEALEAIKVPR